MTHPMYKLLGTRPKRGAGFIEVILTIVGESTGLTPEQIKMKTRKRETVEARQICMTIAKELTKCSLSKIGSLIGGKDHATVLHSNKVINNLIETDRTFKGKYDMIMNHVLLYVDNSNNFVCPICGGIDILIKAWTNPNLDRFVRYFKESDASITDTYCDNCDAHVELILGKEFNYDGEHSVEAVPNSVQELHSHSL